jgi:hypothetical protein
MQLLIGMIFTQQSDRDYTSIVRRVFFWDEGKGKKDEKGGHSASKKHLKKHVRKTKTQEITNQTPEDHAS